MFSTRTSAQLSPPPHLSATCARTPSASKSARTRNACTSSGCKQSEASFMSRFQNSSAERLPLPSRSEVRKSSARYDVRSPLTRSSSGSSSSPGITHAVVPEYLLKKYTVPSRFFTGTQYLAGGSSVSMPQPFIVTQSVKSCHVIIPSWSASHLSITFVFSSSLRSNPASSSRSQN